MGLWIYARTAPADTTLDCRVIRRTWFFPEHETYGLGPERALIVKPIPGARLTWLSSMLGHQENATLRLAVAG